MIQKKLTAAVGALAVVAFLGACQGETEAPEIGVEEAGPVVPEAEAPAVPAQPEIAAARLTGADGTEYGIITFTETAGGVDILADLQGVPQGSHGIHLHEGTACEPPDFQSAGGHYNPSGAPHAGPDAAEHHAGDFGNVEIGAEGTGRLQLTSEMLNVGGANAGVGGTTSDVVGHAVILHAEADDLTSQPSGNAGSRLACGVVEMGTGPEAGMGQNGAAAAGGETAEAADDAI